MKKRIIAFYDVLFYAIVCGPLIVIAVILSFNLITKGTFEWKLKNWYLVITFAFSVVLPIAGTLLFRYCIIDHNLLYFHYFPFTTSWETARNNIDINCNQNVFISEIKDIEIVKLTKEEKETKVFYKHWFNKYLKINLKSGNSKYVYVGNYSNFQIKSIIHLVINQTQN